ncbi:MAG: ABC-type transport auxiliary lipoprotein family protein [Alphaproteobacteria bacterium]
MNGNSIPRRSFMALLLGGTGAALVGCESVLPGAQRDAPNLYELSPKSTFDSNLPRFTGQLIVEMPVAGAGLVTNRIPVKTSDTKFEYFARSEWIDIAPKMVQTLLIESFENTNKIVAVGRESAGLRADYVLKTELREFQVETYGTGGARVRVRLALKLVRMPERVIISSTSFEASEKPANTEVAAAIPAFDEALGKVLRRTVEWTLRNATADQRRRPRTF